MLADLICCRLYLITFSDIMVAAAQKVSSQKNSTRFCRGSNIIISNYCTGYEGEFCQYPAGTLKDKASVTWSAMGQCKKKSHEASHNTVTESIAYIEEEIEESEAARNSESIHAVKNSHSSVILSALLGVVMIGGLAVFVFMRRDNKEKHEYDADAVWPPPGANLAPMGRTWTYPASGDSNPANWEYSNQHGPLHDVVIN